uniref:NF-kappa-B inhibitor protein n=1 Tax=Clytia hemisphaerica TaxID=252671 RepID=A0A069DUV5_9CNID
MSNPKDKLPNQPIDSGIGDSFGPDFVPDDERTLTEELENLNIQPSNQINTKTLLDQAFTPDEENDTYLHVYIAKNSPDEAMQLIEMCPDKNLLNIQNYLGQTPLHVASYVNLDKVAMSLVHHDANLEIQDRDGKNVFHICAERGHIETLENVIKMACQTNKTNSAWNLLHSTDFEGQAPFFLAALNKKKQMCVTLAKLNIDVNQIDIKNGNTPIHEAILEQNIDYDFLEFLVKTCNLNINAQNYAGITALHLAAGRNDSNTYSKLLELGANDSFVDIRDFTPEMCGPSDSIQLLNGV